jgi:hypothetical protein
MLMSVSFAPEITAPLWSFTEPAMLPVGEAETVGANINMNAERRVHRIEDTLDGFIAASVRRFGNASCNHLGSLGYSGTANLYSQPDLR